MYGKADIALWPLCSTTLTSQLCRIKGMCALATIVTVQGSAKEWSLGCVKRAHAARGGQDAGITQPSDHSLAGPCTALFYSRANFIPPKTGSGVFFLLLFS